jgi:hypothetical protein
MIKKSAVRAGVWADGGEKDDDSCKNKLQFVNIVFKLVGII